MKRKSPAKHRVKSHKRKEKRVQSYTRGNGRKRVNIASPKTSVHSSHHKVKQIFGTTTNSQNSNDIQTVIRQVIKDFLETGNYKSAGDIANSDCEKFAEEVTKRFSGTKAYSNYVTMIDSKHIETDEDMPGHVWIKYKGKYYDSDCPEGVRNWKNLPIFSESNVY